MSSFVESVEVVDEYTVKFKLLSPVNYFPLLVATQPYSPISPECYSEDAFDADSMCGGVGPYKITKWERDVELVLEAYDGYPGAAPKTSKIIIKYYSDATTMRLAAESGEIDIASKTLNPTDYADLEEAGELQVIEGPGAQIRYLCFNVTTPPFDQAEIRQAFLDYQRTEFGGWPWETADPTHGHDGTRFARHADGRVEHAVGRRVDPGHVEAVPREHVEHVGHGLVLGAHRHEVPAAVGSVSCAALEVEFVVVVRTRVYE